MPWAKQKKSKITDLVKVAQQQQVGFSKDPEYPQKHQRLSALETDETESGAFKGAIHDPNKI